MLKIKLYLILIISIIVAIPIINSCCSTLTIPKIPLERTLNSQTVNKNIQFSIIETGTVITQKAFAFKGGSLFKNHKIVHMRFG
ncbi:MULTISPECIES: hypothetical protein [Flavobacterium]|jgi:hypothetical protein|uniref:Uncharacterized protein n=2 Tax=Flavobacterium TaxID=237 RepID=A0A1S1JBW5_9FLAO|nr:MULTISPECIES: hypothetical protein [Flavobacterium]MCC9020509.1 hypothetical protein [Flavobacterium sp. F-126]MDL2145487.1 hypothetical protein [Flavobacterium tructae]OHT47064.1 hypothetical protein BHE19_21770 [Flavobacterium tructae]OXB15749.1 hypothetical protein B0A71_20220 [Flavobacterium tructae]